MQDICGAYLFDNTLVELEVNREVLKLMLERCASYFDLVDGEYELRDGEPDYTGRLVVIGTDIDEHKLEELFGIA